MKLYTLEELQTLKPSSVVKSYLKYKDEMGRKTLIDFELYVDSRSMMFDVEGNIWWMR